MTLEEAFAIVLSLANENVLDEFEADSNQLIDERDSQLKAIEKVEEFVGDLDFGRFE